MWICLVELVHHGVQMRVRFHKNESMTNEARTISSSECLTEELVAITVAIILRVTGCIPNALARNTFLHDPRKPSYVSM